MTDSKDLRAVSTFVFDALKEIGRESEITVTGFSMHPLITDGDTVVVRHSLEGITPGSVIAFRKAHRIIVHRVIKCYTLHDRTVYVNKGDANRHIDRRVVEEEVLGKVIGIVRRTGRIDLEGMVWRSIGYAVVAATHCARILPERIARLKMIRAGGRVAYKVLSSALRA